jgi:hypothetical protein
VRSSPGKKQSKTNPTKIKYNDQQRNEMDYDEPHLMSNDKTQPIQWTEQPTGALVAAGSFWPRRSTSILAILRPIRVLKIQRKQNAQVLCKNPLRVTLLH